MCCLFADDPESDTAGLSMEVDIKEEKLIDVKEEAATSSLTLPVDIKEEKLIDIHVEAASSGLTMSVEIKEQTETPSLTMAVYVKEEELSATTSFSPDHGKHITAKRKPEHRLIRHLAE